MLRNGGGVKTGLKIKKAGAVDIELRAPPSKSYTHRALICAALAEGESFIRNPLDSEDIDVTVNALIRLGVSCRKTKEGIAVDGCGGVLPDVGEVTIDCKNSGTTLRLLSTLSLLSPGRVTLTGTKRMRERPVGDLADAIIQAGGDVIFTGNEGFPPLRISGTLSGGRVIVDASKSSQYVSSLMLSGPYSDYPMNIMPKGSIASKPYLRITADVMRAFGIIPRDEGDGSILIPQDVYSVSDYSVEGDYSSASYLFAVAAVCGGRVKVSNLNPYSIQGDRAFLGMLRDMGCDIDLDSYPDSVVAECRKRLSGIEVNMSGSPDVIQTLAAVALFADGPTTIHGIKNLKYKESDRIRAVINMAEACGGAVEAGDDTIVISPAEFRECRIDPADDHRTAMSAAVIGLGAGGVEIDSPECVSKSYPEFFSELRRAGLLHE
ncbi:3-phosphoshikimate 1-carboxyvinyltransferase [Methanoplanus endosymbiosus]|uniref:3-phosphoshikimate 1-carboxyvinyltransferase n=1 Tax=Methanoplanus endosymbiosus TaxID=33865 RepID=A0A9E7PJZ7_9EURY|nr:3-phosphoshikimate 1-carboxyvinyltransferase [Methanoplanus endosymbiosus]UUX91339.1 3-phosphoshikimate 1-carboxyvinyltransferase [Methanoplanus endosymbiosus]